MNQAGPDMYYHNMSAAQGPQPQQVQSYNPHQQPPLLQPGPGQYPAPPYQHQYHYNNGLTSPPQGPPQVSNSMVGQNVLPLPGGVGGQQGIGGGYQAGFDTTGQIAPPGMKPRVTATLWEDEGSLCFQVEARGICVARREDNHMINGTKLLNVAGMTRGRRDGILKSEKIRHVVKIGPMHLKGVWIPFERALDFANKEKITELLYPLFVHNIAALLYHPTNQTRTSQVMAAAERRKQEALQQNGVRSNGGMLPGVSSVHSSVHHHSMSMPGPQPPLSTQHNIRPSLDRAHTFPTPPASASSVMTGMGSQDSYQQWPQQGMSGQQPANPMSIDTGLSNNAARSMPATPATTPPGPSLQSMQSYPPGSQSYDNSRQLYNPSTSQQSPYPPSNANSQDRGMYTQTNYVKNDMGPPSSRPAVPEDTKASSYPGQGEHVSQHPQGEEEAEHEHDGEYTHDSNGYDASRNSYYSNPAPVSSMPSEHQHMPAEMTGSPHQATSGRATPRTAQPPQPYYGGYTPPHTQNPPRRDYTNTGRDQTNGAPANDVYAPQPDMNSSMQQNGGYASQQPAINGGIKRGRDDEDDRPSSGGSMDIKRRKTLMDGSAQSSGYIPAMNTAAPAVASQRRR